MDAALHVSESFDDDVWVCGLGEFWLDKVLATDDGEVLNKGVFGENFGRVRGPVEQCGGDYGSS